MIVDYRNIDDLESFSLLEEALERVPKDQIIKVLLDNNFVQEQIEEYLIIRKLFYINESKHDHEIIIIDKFSKEKTKKKKKENKQDLDESSIRQDLEKARPKKILYLNNDFIGSGENGRSLLLRFLKTFKAQDAKFEYIILVNNAVKIASLQGHIAFQALKDLSENNNILSSQTCLEYYNLMNKLLLGRAAKLEELSQILLKHEIISL